MKLGVRTTNLLGVTTIALLAFSGAGCSSLPTVPDWVDPTSWFGSDENASAADNAQTPDLASIPDKPASTPPDDQQKVAESLAADRSNAKYSAEALRAGTEPAAAPPPDVAPAQIAEAEAEKAKAAKPAPVPVEPPRPRVVDRSVAQDPSGTAPAGALPPTPAGTPVAAVQAPADDTVKTAALPEPPAPAPKRTRVAALEPATSSAPVQSVAPMPPAPVSRVSPSDAELGFRPSAAPPLDASVSQFVATPILNRYRQTAAGAGMGVSSAPTTGYAAVHRPRHTRVASAATSSTSSSATDAAPVRHASHRAMGGPEKMSGNVVANFDALQPTGAAPATNAVYSSTSGTPATAVVFFPGDGVGLSGDARAQVRAAVEQYRTAGGQGFIRVVGHSSSRTPNMSPEQHVAVIFRKSQDRANAVAQELIRDGVPADKVLVEAVGDSQPVFYESMPKGEDGNRRAEIFVQG